MRGPDVSGPKTHPSTAPYGFTQYTDADGDYLTFGAVKDEAERHMYGIVAAIATPNPDGVGLTAEQARDLARRLGEAADAWIEVHVHDWVAPGVMWSENTPPCRCGAAVPFPPPF